MGVGTLRRYREAGIRLKGAPSNEATEFVDLTKLTVVQLREYAATRGIHLGDARLKAEVVDVISRAAVPPVADPNGEQITDDGDSAEATEGDGDSTPNPEATEGAEGEQPPGDTTPETPAE